MKSQIIERLGQTDILLPSLIAEGLAANDRVKVRLSILQAAGRHARDPQARFDLADECRTAGIDPWRWKRWSMAPACSRRADYGARPRRPRHGDLGRRRDMVRAVKAGGCGEGEERAGALAAIKPAASRAGARTRSSLRRSRRLTGLSDGEGDSLHRLVMDLHKALNRLSAAHAEEVVAGAHVYGLLAEDRPAVEAFMRGVESTRKLKFDHPGPCDDRDARRARGSPSRTTSARPTRMWS